MSEIDIAGAVGDELRVAAGGIVEEGDGTAALRREMALPAVVNALNCKVLPALLVMFALPAVAVSVPPG